VRAGRSHARAVDQFFIFFYRVQPARSQVFFFNRAQLARWKSCFTSAAQPLRGAGF
jgi:hypothetical protein